MKKYSRVTYEVRCQIYAYMQAGITQVEMARKTGYHKATISREIRRNSSLSCYNPKVAHKYYRSRYSLCRRPYKLIGFTKELVEKKLTEGWSPAQISGRLKLESTISISHECIYKLVRNRRKHFAPMMRRMKTRRSYYKKNLRNKPRQVDLKISDRSNWINQRKRIGDWERDTMLMKNRIPILVCVERKTRLVKLARARSHTSNVMNDLTLSIIGSLGRKIHSITNDRGHEFLRPVQGVKTYYCDPQAPQQRGTVENTIGLLRQYAKTSVDPKEITNEFLQKLEIKLNMRPRKCLNYLTPYEVFFKTKVALAN